MFKEKYNGENMSTMNVPNADYIPNLPSDVVEPKPHEYKLLQDIFSMGNIGKIDEKTTRKIAGEIKEPLIIIILFVIICIPPVVGLLHSILPMTKSNIYLQIVIQAVVLAILFFVIKNITLAMAKKE